MSTARAEKLIARLVEDPEKAAGEGSTYQLFEEYAQGYPLETLRPLLEHSHPVVQRAATWILSEFGKAAEPLLDAVVPLLEHSDLRVSSYALDIVAVCATAQIRYNGYVLRALTGEDPVFRWRAMKLLGNTGDEELEAILALQEELAQPWTTHVEGLQLLARTPSSERRPVVERLLGSDDPLLRKYGAMLARRAYEEDPGLIGLASQSEDPDVRRYAEGEIYVLGEY